jgi:hypothetical protein
MDVGHAAIGAGSMYNPLMVNEEGIGRRRNVRTCGRNGPQGAEVPPTSKERKINCAVIKSSAEIAEEERRCVPVSLGCHGSSPLAYGLYPNNHSNF